MRLFACVALLVSLNSGCAALSAKLSNLSQTSTALAEDFRQQQLLKQEAKAAQREEWQQCREAQREAARQQLNAKTAQTMQAKMSVDLTQNMSMGQLEVDVPALEQLLAQRKEEAQQINEINGNVAKAQREAYLRNYKNEAARQMQMAQASCDCSVPQPTAPAMAPPPLPVQPSLLPTQIPVVWRGTLNIGFQNAGLTEAKSRRLPTQPSKQECKPSCAPGCVPACSPSTPVSKTALLDSDLPSLLSNELNGAPAVETRLPSPDDVAR